MLLKVEDHEKGLFLNTALVVVHAYKLYFIVYGVLSLHSYFLHLPVFMLLSQHLFCLPAKYFYYCCCYCFWKEVPCFFLFFLPVLNTDCELHCICLLREPDLLFSILGSLSCKQTAVERQHRVSFSSKVAEGRIYIIMLKWQLRIHPICRYLGHCRIWIEDWHDVWHWAKAFIHFLAGYAECIYIFTSKGFPQQAEPLTPDLLGLLSILPFCMPMPLCEHAPLNWIWYQVSHHVQ